MFWADIQTLMFMECRLNGRKNRFESVDMKRCRIDRVRKCLRLASSFLVRMVEEVTNFWILFKHSLIKMFRNRHTMLFQNRRRRFYNLNRLLI